MNNPTKVYVRKMAPEEAVRAIKISMFYVSEEREKTVFSKALDVAVEALEKQIPKNPAVIREYNGLDMYYLEFACPNCGKGSAGKMYKLSRCEFCGQALDWDNCVDVKDIDNLVKEMVGEG